MRTVTTAQVATDNDATGELPERVHEALGELAGPKGRHDGGETAKRHGHGDGSVTLSGRRVVVSRPRVRSADDERQVALETHRHFADRDPLTELVFEQMLAGVSTRRFARTREPVGREVEADASSGMLEAERQFRRIVGYRDLASSRSPSSVRSPQSVTSEEHGAQFRALEYRRVPKARVGHADGVSRLCGRAPWTTISRPL